MGIANTENDPNSTLYRTDEQNRICFFCHKKIAGLFVMWIGTEDLHLHHECACKLGQQLIRDGLDAAELASRTTAGLPARLRPTVVPYQTEASTEDKAERLIGGSTIRMTGSGSDREVSGRQDRLSEVLCYAAGRASVKRHVDERVFLSSILAVHDHKGCLAVLWQNPAAAISFGALMVDAWEFACENGEMVDHYVTEDNDGRPERLLYSGRDPRNWNNGHYGTSPF